MVPCGLLVPTYSKFGPCISLVGPIDGSGPHADGTIPAFCSLRKGLMKPQEVWTGLVPALEKMNEFGKVGWRIEHLRKAVGQICSKDRESSSRA